jgi:hypothetical protein
LQICSDQLPTVAVNTRHTDFVLFFFAAAASLFYRQKIYVPRLLILLTLVVNCRCWWLLILVRTIMVGRNDYKYVFLSSKYTYVEVMLNNVILMMFNAIFQ